MLRIDNLKLPVGETSGAAMGAGGVYFFGA